MKVGWGRASKVLPLQKGGGERGGGGGQKKL